jgi:hypothetical protein
MTITYRRELHFTCEGFDLIGWNPCCEDELLLDQLDAPTKKGMFAKARKAGWTWDKKTLCPSCTKIYNQSLKQTETSESAEFK